MQDLFVVRFENGYIGSLSFLNLARLTIKAVPLFVVLEYQKGSLDPKMTLAQLKKKMYNLTEFLKETASCWERAKGL